MADNPSDSPTEGALGLPLSRQASTGLAPATDEAPLGSRHRLGPYEVETVLGAGGMGVVYCGRHLETGERVALKTASRLRASQLASIRAEVAALAELRHPDVVRVVGSGVEDGLPWYAMELLEGRTLEDWLVELWRDAPAPPAPRTGLSERARMRSQRAPAPSSLARRAPLLSPAGPEPAPAPPASAEPEGEGPVAEACAGRLRSVLTLVRQLCEPLAHIHARGLVHRDLKPTNVFIRPDGRPVLMDFGLAAQFAGASGREVLDVRGMRMGTGYYMAPEQGEGQLVDARADLYSLGVMLFELVTGERPFTGRSAPEVIEQHHSVPPRAPSDLVSGVPAELDTLILRLLAKRRRDRLGHADDVAEALVRLGAEPGPAVATSAYLYRPDLEGRAVPLTRLSRELALAVRGHGSCVLLGGESGVGKTSLCAGLARRARLDGVAVITGECRPLGNVAPLHPLAPLFHAVADHCLEHGRPATRRILGPRGRTLERYEPALAALPGQSELAPAQGLTATAARERLFADLAGVLAAFAAERPLLLVLDDLQWADELTLDFVASLPAAFFDVNRLMLLGTYRSEEVGEQLRRLVSRAGVQVVDLARLDRTAVREMVGGMLALAHPDEPLVEFLASHSEGNPFFVAEYLRTAVASHLLYRGDGTWKLSRPPGSRDGDLALPRTLRELVDRRFSDLGPAAEAVLAAACVLGREIDPELLAITVAVDEASVMSTLAELRARAVVEQAPHGALRFVHDKLREVAYDRLAPERRADLHGRAARALEQRHGDSGPFDLHAGDLANHWERAGDAARARIWLERAGMASLQAGACREAEHALRRALDHDDALQAEGRGLPTLARARTERLLGEAYYGLARFPDARTQLDRTLRCVGSSVPAPGAELTRRVLVQVGQQALHRLGGVDPFSEDRPVEDAPEPVQAWHRLVHIFFQSQEMGRYIHANLSLLNLAEQAPPSVHLADAYALTCLVAGSLSLHRIAEWYWRRALRAASLLKVPAAEASALMITSLYGTGAGQWARVREATARGTVLADQVGDHRRFAENTALAADVAFYTGDVARSLTLWSGLLARVRHHQPRCWALCGTAENLLRRGAPADLTAALHHMELAIEIMKTERLGLADVIRIHGIFGVARLRNGDAEGALAEALTARERIAAHPRTTAFWTIDGAAATAEVLLHALNDRGDATVLAAARDVCRGLAGYASVYPMGRPRALLYEGRLQAAEGREGAARRTLARAITAGEKMEMPHDTALAQLALASLLPAVDEKRQRLRRDALARLAEMGVAAP